MAVIARPDIERSVPCAIISRFDQPGSRARDAFPNLALPDRQEPVCSQIPLESLNERSDRVDPHQGSKCADCAKLNMGELEFSPNGLRSNPKTPSGLRWRQPPGLRRGSADLLLDAGAGNAHRPASRRAQYRPRGGGSSRWRGSPCGGSDVTIRCAILPTRSCIGRPTGLPVSSHTSLSPGVTGCSRCSAASRNSTCPLSAR